MSHPHVSWIDQKSSFTKKLVQTSPPGTKRADGRPCEERAGVQFKSADVYCEALHPSFPLYHPSKRCEIKQLATALI